MPRRLPRYGSPFSERMVKMIIDDILDMMDDLLDSAASVPFSVKKSIIDCDQMRDYINKGHRFKRRDNQTGKTESYGYNKSGAEQGA